MKTMYSATGNSLQYSRKITLKVTSSLVFYIFLRHQSQDNKPAYILNGFHSFSFLLFFVNALLCLTYILLNRS